MLVVQWYNLIQSYTQTTFSNGMNIQNWHGMCMAIECCCKVARLDVDKVWPHKNTQMARIIRNIMNLWTVQFASEVLLTWHLQYVNHMVSEISFRGSKIQWFIMVFPWFSGAHPLSGCWAGCLPGDIQGCYGIFLSVEYRHWFVTGKWSCSNSRSLV